MAPTTGKAYDRRWWTLAVLAMSLLVISLDNTILNVALPTIERELDASAGALQWIVDSYTLVFAGLLLTMGSLGDRFGRRLSLVIGLAVFGAASLLSALATSADMLIASRALMGIGGALIMPSTLSILTNVFPAEERPKAIGIWAAVAGLGIAIGPVAGGWLIEHFSWGSVFLVNLPIVAVALAAAPALVPESRDPKASRLDPVGAMLSTAGLGVLTWAIIEAGGERGWTDGVVLGGFGVALAALVAFVAWELRSSAPMLDVRLFAVRRFSGASVSIALVFFALFGAIFFLTMYLQEVLDYGALEAGLRVTPIAARAGAGRSDLREAGRAARNAQRGGRRADDRGRCDAAAGLGRRPHRLWPDRRVAGADGNRHGRHDGARHRVDHELAAARACGSRIGHERHGEDGRRHAGSRHPRKPPVQQLRCGHGTRGAGPSAGGAGGGRGLDRRRRRGGRADSAAGPEPPSIAWRRPRSAPP